MIACQPLSLVALEALITVSENSRSTPPAINYMEWDGLVRLCFGRKNKTLGAIFRQKDIIDLMKNNFNTHSAVQQNGHDEGSKQPVGPQPQAMAVDGEMSTEKAKEQILQVLEEQGLSDQRSAKMDVDHFLSLLNAFNVKGFHFS
mmetsp:Transcript_5304/g.8489  ORF Transcript_5304/g.8489 Transcript_5304/m.8489 type:complete len:145 (-) Transcript_5304:105-539(-)